MRGRAIAVALSVLATLVHFGTATAADAPLHKLTVFTAPTVDFTPMWVAQERGYYKDVGLDIDFKQTSGGTTAFEAFKAGVGDIIFAGELPAMMYWSTSQKQLRLVMVIDRNTKQLSAIARSGVKDAKDLKGKTLATRVGSTGSWFIGEYLEKNGIKPQDVTIKNLDPQLLAPTLCRGQIDAFFIWDPFAQRALDMCPSEAHRLSYADGYIRGYVVLGARPDWLAKPENADATANFIRATLKGEDYTEKNFDAAVGVMHQKFGLDPAQGKAVWAILEHRHDFDPAFAQDFCELDAWMRGEHMIADEIEFSQLVDAKPLASVSLAADTIPANTCAAH